MNTNKVRDAAKALQLLNSPKTNVLFHGYSMEPLLTEGDRVIVRKVNFYDIRTGDIIVSYEGEKYPARRVLYKKKNSLIVWCDNWAHREILIIRQIYILGKVISRQRDNQLLSSLTLRWKFLTLWAFARLVPGRMIHYCPPLKNYIEKYRIKQGPVYDPKDK